MSKCDVHKAERREIGPDMTRSNSVVLTAELHKVKPCAPQPRLGHYSQSNWEFPKIGDPNVVPEFSRILIIRTPDKAPLVPNRYLNSLCRFVVAAGWFTSRGFAA